VTQPTPVVELRGVTVCRGQVKLLDGVTFRIDVGQHTAILGPNGSGKSTLVKVVSGQLYPSLPATVDPPVAVFGRDRWNVSELRTRIGVVSADLHHRFVAGSSLGRVSGLEAVIASFFGSEVLFLHHEVPDEYRERSLNALSALGAADLAGRRMHEMSSGEVRRVLIARALVHRPEALLLDEPTTGLDLVARGEFLETIRALAQGGTTLILVTHHVEEVIPEIQRVLVMRQGRIAADGPPGSVLNSATLSDAYGAPVSLAGGGGWYRLSANLG
jgi:iron complex transport system ATP-binding protein